MDRYTAGKIEGMLFASRKLIETAAEQLRMATSGAKQVELGMKIARALSELIDVSRDIYAEHPKLNPFLEVEKATAAWQRLNGKPSNGRKARRNKTSARARG